MKNFEKFIFAIYIIVVSIISIFIISLPFNIIPKETLNFYITSLTETWNYAILALFVLFLNICLILLMFKTNAPMKLGIVKYTSEGELVISNDAIKSLILKSLDNVRGIKKVQVYLRPNKDKINILIKASVFPDLNIPNLVKEIQESAKSYIETIAEIPVSEVKVFIEDISSTTKVRFE